MHFLPSSIVKPFIISDNNALVISSGERDFVLPVSFSRGILSKGDFVQGDFVLGGFVRFPLRCVAPFALRHLRCAVCIAPNTESPAVPLTFGIVTNSDIVVFFHSPLFQMPPMIAINAAFRSTVSPPALSFLLLFRSFLVSCCI